MQYNTYYHSARRIAPAPKKSPAKLWRRTLVLVVIGIGVLAVLDSRAPHAQARAAVAPVVQYAKAQSVCLDPGHGGSDPGASTNDGTITERDINLIVAKRVQANLQKDGYRVYMTRTTNGQTLSNHDRYTYCNAMHATILVSIHHNYFQDSSVDYASALFYKDQDQALAADILNSVATRLHLQNDNISQFDDGVLSESTMPAALSEGFFITSDYEYSQLTTAGSTRLNDEADAITQGIITYFTQPITKRPAINMNPQQIERDDSGA